MKDTAHEQMHVIFERGDLSRSTKFDRCAPGFTIWVMRCVLFRVIDYSYVFIWVGLVIRFVRVKPRLLVWAIGLITTTLVLGQGKV